MPTSQKPTVRERYQYRCGYCGVSEAHAGGELTVDHFQPRAVGGGQKVRLLEKQNIELQKTIEAQTRYIQMLEAQLDDLRRA